jgi:hypothetical protein
MARGARRSGAALALTASMVVMAPVVAFGSPSPDPSGVDASVRIDPRSVSGGDIAGHFVGVSIEWTLIDRYMVPNARPGIANLMQNLGSGVLRIGGSSQDQVPFDATAPDSDRVVTPQDLASVRATLDRVDSSAPGTPDWVTVLGTALAPPTSAFPWRGVDHARAFVRDGVAPVFGDDLGRREVPVSRSATSRT